MNAADRLPPKRKGQPGVNAGPTPAAATPVNGRQDPRVWDCIRLSHPTVRNRNYLVERVDQLRPWPVSIPMPVSSRHVEGRLLLQRGVAGVRSERLREDNQARWPFRRTR